VFAGPCSGAEQMFGDFAYCCPAGAVNATGSCCRSGYAAFVVSTEDVHT